MPTKANGMRRTKIQSVKLLHGIDILMFVFSCFNVETSLETKSVDVLSLPTALSSAIESARLSRASFTSLPLTRSYQHSQLTVPNFIG